ncbi:MAG: XdhC family protein [Proteobacteria bacterium]|nr:XdhC family protein [Pseudomonadota bacterium]
MMNNEEILKKATELVAKGAPFALATVVRAKSPTSAKPGSKAIIEAEGDIQGWIGGGCAQPAVIKSARESLQDGQPRLIRVSPKGSEANLEGIIDFGSSCYSSGTLDIFIEPVQSQIPLLIIGSAPVAMSLCTLAKKVGFRVTVAARNVNKDKFQDAALIISEQKLTEVKFTSSPLVIVASQGQRDEACLIAALEIESTYIAFIASSKKADKLKNNLLQRGINQSRVEKIISPAGIAIGASTPEEIALSVLAGLVKYRRSGAYVESNAIQSKNTTESIGELEVKKSETSSSCCSSSGS